MGFFSLVTMMLLNGCVHPPLPVLLSCNALKVWEGHFNQPRLQHSRVCRLLTQVHASGCQDWMVVSLVRHFAVFHVFLCFFSGASESRLYHVCITKTTLSHVLSPISPTAQCRFTYINPLQWAFAALVINEFDDLELSGFPLAPGVTGVIPGETFRKEVLEIEYDNSFKWAAIGINALLALAGLCWGCWVCENVRHDDTKHKVSFHVSCDLDMQHRLRKLRKKSRVSAEKVPIDATVVDVLAEPLLSKTEAYFTFTNVSYTVDVPQSESCPDGKLKLLNGVNGFAKPGMMIALMGTSGAGKTTLLDVSVESLPSRGSCYDVVDANDVC